MTAMARSKKITPQNFLCMKSKQEKISMITAYDFMMAKAFDYSGIDAMLVGDSMGMVIYGQSSTLKVSIDDIVKHTAAVARASPRARWRAGLRIPKWAQTRSRL